VNRENEWKAMEVASGLRYTPHLETQLEIQECGAEMPSANRRVTAFSRIARGEDEFMALKSFFFAGAYTCPNFVQVAGDIPQTSFHFWYYLATVARHGVHNVFEISLLTWGLFLVTMAIFCVCCRVFHVIYVQLLGLVVCVMVGLLIYMYYRVKKEQSYMNLDADLEIAPRGQPDPTKQMVSVATTINIMLQFPLLVISYAISRLICSSWMWIYYPRTSVIMLILTIIFFFIFRLILAPIALMYFVVCALPPNLDLNDIHAVQRTVLFSLEQEKLGQVD